MSTFEFLLAIVRITVWPAATVATVWILRQGVVAFLSRQSGGHVEISGPMLKGAVGWQNGRSRPRGEGAKSDVGAP